MMKNFRFSCPYCNKDSYRNFKLCKQYSNKRDIVCDNCGAKFNAIINTDIKVVSYEEELNKVLPQDIIKTIKDVCSKYLGYTGKGGYEKSRSITIDSEISEELRPYDNCYHITFGGKAKYFDYEYRTVFFDIFADGRIGYCVGATYVWHQNYWWQGETLEEKVDNYIQHALIKWETI